MPSVNKFLHIIFGGFSYKKVIGLAECFELFCSAPITGGESREIRPPMPWSPVFCGRLSVHPKTSAWNCIKIISRGTSIYVQYAKFLPTIRTHCVCEVFNLASASVRLEQCVCPRGSSGDSRDCSARQVATMVLPDR